METFTNDLFEIQLPIKTEDKTAKKTGSIVLDDAAYLEGYFKVCKFLQLKRKLLNDCTKNPRLRNVKGYTSQQLDTQLIKLNNIIKHHDMIFWNNVKRSKGQGIKFSIEKLIKRYDLNAFEWKVLLFYLYIEFYNVPQDLLYEKEVLRVFDTEDSVAWRIKNFSSFSRESALLRNNLLYRAPDKNKFGLCVKGINALSDILNGKKAKASSRQNRELLPGTSVGFEKKPEYCLDDVVLTKEIKEKVLFFLDTFKNKNLEKSGVFKKIKKAKGINFLFYGPPGTGKSILAEAVATHLKRKLLVVDFSKIMGKYLGDTDKNIASIFESAKRNNLVVCIDEADSLLYNRSYADQDFKVRFVNEMLVELERFEGVVILTTNMDSLLDPALERRVSLKVKFDLPCVDMRTQIWKSHIPENIKISDDVDFALLATKYTFAGGHIKNAVLNALRKIILKKESTITMNDFIFGADMESDGLFTNSNDTSIEGFAGRSS